MSFETSAILLSWMAIAVLSLAMSGLLRQVRELTGQQIAPISDVALIGRPAPRVEGLESVAANVLVFGDKECPACREIWPIVEERAAIALIDGTELTVVLRGGESASVIRGARVVIDADAFHRFRVPVTPFAVFVNGDGVIVDGKPIGSADAFRTFLERAQRVEAARVGIVPEIAAS